MTNLLQREPSRTGVSTTTRRGSRMLWWLAPSGVISGFGLLLVVVLLVMIAGSPQRQETVLPPKADAVVAAPAGPMDPGTFDPGNIISDEVFFNATSMTAQQIQAFLDTQSPTCTAATCLRHLQVTTPDRAPTGLCRAYPGGVETFAVALWKIAQACTINPQVLLATIEKESGGLSKVNPQPGWDAAMLGFACPDTGPGGTANCSAEFAGVVAQTWGLAQVFQKYTQHPGDYNYTIGDNQILFNVVEQCQQTKTVNIVNQATANLYIYTPYTPSDESLAAYPAAVTGPGAACASYGNRNFWHLFTKYFGSTGGGAPTGPAAGGGAGTIVINGPSIELPAAAGVAGTIKAPNMTTAKAIAAGLSQLGIPYSWGGGNSAGPTTGTLDGCSANCLANDPLGTVGYDCSGLMQYAWGQVGVDAPRNSQNQARSGQQVPYEQRAAGDMIGFPGHVAMYVGTFDGTDYMLEAPYSGSQVRVAPVRDGHYGSVARIWGELA